MSTDNRDIIFSGWLTLTPPRRGTLREGAMKLTKGQPTLAPSERACKVRIVCPASLFTTPQLSAQINFDGHGPDLDPIQLSADVADVLRGADFSVEVRPANDGEST